MNRYIITSIAAILLTMTVACNEDEVFEREQYKNRFALVSSDNNVYTMVHDLRLAESTGYVSASLGGSNPYNKNIDITLIEDDALIDRYNHNMYDMNDSKYIPPLPKDKYSIGSYRISIPAGERRGSIPIKIRPAGLRPDTACMIALRVESFSSGEINPEKDYVLYQVQTKNWWATSEGIVYTSRGTRQEENLSPINLYRTKKVYPLAGTTVRMIAGTEDERRDAGITSTYLYSIAVVINDDNTVRITPYGTLQVTQIDGDPDYPNVVTVETDEYGRTYKTFLLSYSYKGASNRIYTMREEIQLEFRENPADPRFLTNMSNQ